MDRGGQGQANMRYILWISLCVAWTAQAQEMTDHSWITEGHYSARDDGRQHCCDAKYHCRRLKPDEVEAVDGDTWRIKATNQTFKRGEMGNYPSLDGRFWQCRWSDSEPVARRCFFYAEAGM